MAISSDCSADVGEDDVGDAVAVDVAGGQVGEPGLVALRFVAGDRLEPLSLASGLEHAESIGAGDQQVVAAVAVEIGHVHAGEVDRADQQAAAGPVDAILEGEEQERLGGAIEQDDLLGAVAVGVEGGGPEDLGRVAAGVVLILDVPVAVGVEQDPAREGILGDDHRGPVEIHQAHARRARRSRAGPRLPANGRGGPSFSPRTKQGRSVILEDRAGRSGRPG